MLSVSILDGKEIVQYKLSQPYYIVSNKIMSTNNKNNNMFIIENLHQFVVHVVIVYNTVGRFVEEIVIGETPI